MTKKAWPCTAEEITKARADGLSWRAVAEKCGLKSPSAARTAYTDLTGVDHQDAPGQVRRAPKGTGVRAQAKAAVAAIAHSRWDVDSDQDEIIERLTPQRNDNGELRKLPTIVIERTISAGTNGNGYALPVHREELRIQKLIGLHFEKDDTVLAIDFVEAYTGNQRCCRVDNIVEVW